MRRLLCFALVLLVLAAPLALAHSGGTDSQGGHYNRSTGEYHYHHGEPAHQHPGGVCPYAAKTTTKPTAKPAATTKPTKFASVYAYRSDQMAAALKATAKPTAASVRSSSKNFALPDFAFPLMALSAFNVFAIVCIALSIRHKYKTRENTLAESLDNSIRERKLLDANLHEARKQLSNISGKHEHLTRSLVTLQQEYQSLSDKYHKLTDSCVAAHATNRHLEKELADLGQLYNDLYSIWSESQLVGIENHAIVSEAMVFVGPSGIYHTRIHGDWHNYRLIPLSEALALRYRPCSLCVPAERFKS